MSLQKPSTSRNKKTETNYLVGYKKQMTKFFLEINNDSYNLEHLTYKSETKVFTVLTEIVGGRQKVNRKCPEESENYSFIKILYFNPPPGNIKSIDKIFE